MPIRKGKDASFTLYEDEGTNYNYEKGPFNTIQFTYNETSKKLTIYDRQGSFTGMARNRKFNVVWVSRNKALPLHFKPNSSQQIGYEGKKITLKF